MCVCHEAAAEEWHWWVQWHSVNWEGRSWLSANMAAQDELSKFLSALSVINISPNVVFVAVKHTGQQAC